MGVIYFLLLITILFNGLAAVLIRLLGKNERCSELPSFLYQFLGALIFIFFVKDVPPFSTIWLFPLVAGFFYGLGSIFMFKAFEKGEVSLLSPLGNINPAITLLFSVILLRESLTLYKLVTGT